MDISLNTGMYIHEPVDPEELLRFSMDAVLTLDSDGRSYEELEQIERATTSISGRNVVLRAAEETGRPLPVTLGLWHDPHGPIVTEAEAANLAQNCPNGSGKPGESHCNGTHCPPHHLLIGMSTTHLYADERGWNCASVHAALLWLIGGFLDTKGVSWSWMNELMPHIQTGYDDLPELARRGEPLARQAMEEFAGLFGRGNGTLIALDITDLLFGKNDED